MQGAANLELEDMIHFHNITAESFSGFNLTALFPPTIKGVYQYNGEEWVVSYKTVL